MVSFTGKKIIIFDLDGTLVRLAVDWIYLKNLLSDRYSKIYNTDSSNFATITDCLDYIVGRDDEKELSIFFNIIREYELKGIPESKIIKEPVYFIKNKEDFGVNKDVKFAICSLNTRKGIIEALKLANISEEFDFITGREDVRKWKPDPKGLLKIQQHFKVKKEEMIYFGDLPKDLQTGKNANIAAYLIDEIIKLVNRKLNIRN